MSLLRQNGCLYVYSSREMAQKWAWGANLRRSLGVEMQDVEGEALFALEPDLRGSFGYGQFAPDNGSTPDPSALVKAIHAQAIKDGATHLRASVTGFRMTGGRVDEVLTDTAGALAVDGVVVAAGAWSGALARQLGTKVPLESQRGYHVTVTEPGISLSRNVMAVEQNIMVNPMTMGLRLAGTVELAGLKAPPNHARSQALLNVGKKMFPKMNPDPHEVWMGHRPCMPDSMPVIGRAPRVENAWLGFGHGHVGMCGGATTGRELANLIGNRSPEIDLSPFAPDRFTRSGRKAA